MFCSLSHGDNQKCSHTSCVSRCNIPHQQVGLRSPEYLLRLLSPIRGTTRSPSETRPPVRIDAAVAS